MKRPDITEYHEYYHKYISLVQENAIDTMQSNVDAYVSLLSQSGLDLDYTYGPEKWTVRECIVHLCDADRIFAYRALRIARGDETALPGFEQDHYVEFNDFGHLTAQDLIAMVKTTINGTITLFRHLTKEDTEKVGTASNHPVSVRALAYMTAGHAIHHLNIFRERYGLKV